MFASIYDISQNYNTAWDRESRGKEKRMYEENAPKHVLARVIAISRLLATVQKPDKKPAVRVPEKPGSKRPAETATPNTPLQ
jgi:hypothetical protein